MGPLASILERSTVSPWLWWAALPAFATGLGLLNLATWPRGRRGTLRPSVSVLVPARNEEATIEACLRAALAADPAEIWVYDDGSTDRTFEIVTELSKLDPRIKRMRGSELPAGWVGKPHACHRLSQMASSEVLLFVDADTQLTPDALERFADLEARFRTPVITAFPAQVMASWSERLVVPLLHLTYLSWLPLFLIPRTRTSAVLAANGQTLWVRRLAYQRIGGFRAVRDAIVDDMAFCRRAKRVGLRVLFADGARIARCRMYRSWREVFEGFSKNLYVGLGARPERLAAVSMLYWGAYMAPAVGVAGGAGAPAWVGLGLVALLRLAVALRYGHPLGWSLVGHPLAVLLFVWIGLNSMRWSMLGQIRWRGRTYGTRVRSDEGFEPQEASP
jgi:chlorobactene glucosyltransferase